MRVSHFWEVDLDANGGGFLALCSRHQLFQNFVSLLLALELA